MKLKFGMVGPSGCGKTLIANILGNEMSMDNSIGRPPYRPTNSVRIVEFSVPSVDFRKFNAEVDVQIWEIGGNPRLKSIWPGVQSNLDGIILVYDTNNELHVRDMSALHMHFVTHSSLNPAQCLIIGNQFRGSREVGPAKIVGVGPRVRHFVVNVDDDPNYLREEFRHFLTGVAQLSMDQEKSQNNAMNSSYIPMSHFSGGEGDAPMMVKPRPLKRRNQNQQQQFAPPQPQQSEYNDDNDGDPFTHPMYYDQAQSRQNNMGNWAPIQRGDFSVHNMNMVNSDSETGRTSAITASLEALRVADVNPYINRFTNHRSYTNGNGRVARDEFSIHRKSTETHHSSQT